MKETAIAALEYLSKQDMKVQAEKNGSAQISLSDGEKQGEMQVYPLYDGITLMTGIFHLQEIAIAPVNHYNRLLLNYCMKGRCEVNLGNGRYIFLQPDYLSIDVNPAQNCFRCPSGNYAGIAILFNFDVIKGVMPPAFLDLDLDPYKIKEQFCNEGISYISRIPQYLADLFLEIDENRDHSISDYRLLLFRILKALDSLNPIPDNHEVRWLTKGQIDIAKRVEEKITKNLRKKYLIIELADEYGISASSLKNYFQSVYGESISEYLRSKKVAAAQKLLEKTNQSIAEIALTVGYENQSKFAAVFKRSKGIGPVEYRRLSRAEK